MQRKPSEPGMGRAALGMALAAMLFAGAASGQEHLSSIIESEGTATILVEPNRAEFWLYLSVADAQLETAMENARGFEEELRAALAAREVQPSEIQVSAPAIPPGEGLVQVSARLRFNLGAYTHPETGYKQFAALCDRLAAIAADLECGFEGPFLQVRDPESVVRAAVTRATENAYGAAEAIAAALNSTIFAVETVSISGVVWNETPGHRGAQPTLKEMSCTANVRVIYVLAGS